MQIRKAVASDYADVMVLYNIFVGEDRYSQHDYDSFIKVLESDHNYIFVAEDAGKIIGFVTFSIRDVVRYPRPIAELDELFISEEYRKHGLGKQFMEKIEELAREKNCYRMYIESRYDFKGAHSFYEKLGYTNYGYHFLKDL
jgi:GNAT superfamily N-acetyltransferase